MLVLVAIDKDNPAREGVAEQQISQHVNEKLDTVSVWLTGSFTTL